MPKQPPKYLEPIARRKWRELYPTLPDNEQATLDALGQYCVAWSRWLAADDDEDKIRWSRCVRQWGAELRLTPKSRSSKAKASTADDPILKLCLRENEGC